MNAGNQQLIVWRDSFLESSVFAFRREGKHIDESEKYVVMLLSYPDSFRADYLDGSCSASTFRVTPLNEHSRLQGRGFVLPLPTLRCVRGAMIDHHNNNTSGLLFVRVAPVCCPRAKRAWKSCAFSRCGVCWTI